jgi:DNA-binding XRE family transcriptional regulator
MLTKEQQVLFYKKLGESIKAARIQGKHKQESVAHHLGLNRISIVNIEKGKQKVQVHTLIELASYFNVKMDDLLPPLDYFKSVSIVDPKLAKSIQKELEQVEDKEEIGIRLKDFISYLKSKSS